jgi:hypothetical protein
VADWQFSSFHRFVQLGIYPSDWAGEGLQDTNSVGMDDGFRYALSILRATSLRVTQRNRGQTTISLMEMSSLKTWRLAMTVEVGNYVKLLQAVAKAKDVCSCGGTSSALWLTRPWLT